MLRRLVNTSLSHNESDISLLLFVVNDDLLGSLGRLVVPEASRDESVLRGSARQICSSLRTSGPKDWLFLPIIGVTWQKPSQRPREQSFLCDVSMRYYRKHVAQIAGSGIIMTSCRAVLVRDSPLRSGKRSRQIFSYAAQRSWSLLIISSKCILGFASSSTVWCCVMHFLVLTLLPSVQTLTFRMGYT